MFTGECWIPGKSPSQVEKDHLARYQFASEYVKDRAVLDIASGAGLGSKMLREAGAILVHGVEFNPALVRDAQRKYETFGLVYRFGDICTVKSEVKYQAVVCFETIEHILNYRIALANLYQLMTLGGLLIISTPHRGRGLAFTSKPDNPFHTQEFTTEELTTELERANFKVVERYGQHQRGGNEQVELLKDDGPPRYIILVGEK